MVQLTVATEALLEQEQQQQQQQDTCDRIQVAVRIRPHRVTSSTNAEPRIPSSPTSHEKARGILGDWANTKSDDNVWKVERDDNSPCCVLTQKGVTRRAAGRNVFSVDCVLEPDATTDEVYQQVAKPIVKAVAHGQHGTICAYGQTGSGKTFTMQGAPHYGIDDQDNLGDNALGVIQLAAADLFVMLQEQEEARNWTVRAQYFEIYDERLRDLLVEPQDRRHSVHSCSSPTQSRISPASSSSKSRGRKSLGSRTATTEGSTTESSSIVTVRENRATGSLEVNATSEKVTCLEDVVKLLSRGRQNRVVAATHMSPQSSRSHAIFRLTVQTRSRTPITSSASLERLGRENHQILRVSTLNLVDLAGSENSKSAGVTGIRKRESGKINQSLLSLSRVIHALSLPRKKRPKHIGYRDSKLTRILQPHLSGNARLAILCCISPSKEHVEETRSTLKFADNAMRVTVKPKINEFVDHHAILRNMEKELSETREALFRLQAAYEDVIHHPEPESDDDDDEYEPFGVRGKFTTVHNGSLTTNSSQVVFDDRDDLYSQRSRDMLMSPGRPPDEVIVMMTETPIQDATTTFERIVGAEQRAKFLAEKLEATDELVEALYKDLRSKERLNQELKTQVMALEERISAETGLGENTEAPALTVDEAQTILRQCLLLKYGILFGCIMYICGQTDMFLAAALFLWLLLEVLTH